MSDCDRLWEVDAFREGRLSASDVDSFQRHQRSCGVCRSRFEQDQHIQALGRSLPILSPDPLAARRTRAAILHRAAAIQERRTGWLFWALPAAAMIVFATVYALSLRPPVPTATSSSARKLESSVVDAAPGAIWSRDRTDRVERISLKDGAITLQVRHQGDGERFLVDLPDGQIEVRGTRFEVAVHEGRAARVRVFEGLVAFRRGDEPEHLLAAGDHWDATTATIPAVNVDELPSAPAAGASSAPPTAAGDAAKASAEYRMAMDDYTAHRYGKAAHEFSAFAAHFPAAAESEDAAFLEAVALARSGDAAAAATVASRFLVRYPNSFHAPDAALLVQRADRDR